MVHRALLLSKVRVQSLRNLRALEFAPKSSINVIYGANGQGKTTLLEAIYFAATSKSFRTSRATELLQHGATTAFVRATFQEGSEALGPIQREQLAAVENRRVVVRMNGNAPNSLIEFATRSPIVVFHAEEMALSTGAAALRRTLLDRLLLFLEPQSLEHRQRYARALKARQELLQRGGDLRAVEAFEALLAKHGARITEMRRRAVATLSDALLSAFAQIAAPEVTLEARYEPFGSDDEQEALRALEQSRATDVRRKSASFGPHRDDVLLLLNGHASRKVASQGQHRAITLALKAAETLLIAEVRGLYPILLLDDVSSELDPERTKALFRFLSLAKGQLFITTTRPELITLPATDERERGTFLIENGELRHS